MSDQAEAPTQADNDLRVQIDQRVRNRLMRVIADFADMHEALRGTTHGKECGICWPLFEVLAILDADSERTEWRLGWRSVRSPWD